MFQDLFDDLWVLYGADDSHLPLTFGAEQEVRLINLLNKPGPVLPKSFDDRILLNLNKGLNVETNLQAIHLMRQLKEEFPQVWGYSRGEGANHGFIHPTPWDTGETSANIQRVLSQYTLPPDILPEHSIPLIVHHASGLGDWIREVERREGVQFKRYGSIIGWWQEGKRGKSGRFILDNP